MYPLGKINGQGKKNTWVYVYINDKPRQKHVVKGRKNI